MRWGPHAGVAKELSLNQFTTLSGQLAPPFLPFSISPHTYKKKTVYLQEKEMDIRRDFQKVLDMYWAPLPCLQGEFLHLSLSPERNFSSSTLRTWCCSWTWRDLVDCCQSLGPRNPRGGDCGRHIAMSLHKGGLAAKVWPLWRVQMFI